METQATPKKKNVKKNKKPYRYKNTQTRGFIIFMCVFGLLMVAAIVSHFQKVKKNNLIYADHLDDVVLTVEYIGNIRESDAAKPQTDEESTDTSGAVSQSGENDFLYIEVTLREYGNYIFDVEGFIQRQALIYDEGDPTRYWNTHFSAGMESSFMTVYAANLAKGSCLQDAVYYILAQNAGFEMSADDKEEAQKNAETFFKGMSDTQKDILGVSEEDVLKIQMRGSVAKAYALSYAESHDVTGYGGSAEDVLSYDGAYFTGVILPDFKVTYNGDVLDKIDMGYITVNRDVKR